MKRIAFIQGVVCFLASFSFLPSSIADEGMWLFNALPKKHLKQEHGFDATDDWARHVMLSSVRFNSGGSASFVSANGLVLTNHHVGASLYRIFRSVEVKLSILQILPGGRW